MLVNPCEMNLLIAAITNHFYTTLSKDEFYCLTVFLNELSKSMFSTILLNDVCGKMDNRNTHGENSTLEKLEEVEGVEALD